MSVLVRTTGGGVSDWGAIPATKRAVGVLSDGTRVACVLDRNQAGVTGDGGDNTGVAKFYIYTSPDGATWTLRATLTPTNAVDTGGSIDGMVFAFCVGKANNNLHLAFKDTTGNIRYYLFTYGAGPTYTAGAQQTVATADAGDAEGFRRIDMDVLYQASGTYTGDCVIVGTYFSDYAGSSGAWSYSNRIYVKRLDTGAWVAHNNVIGTSTQFQYPFYWDYTLAAQRNNADSGTRVGTVMTMMAIPLIYGGSPTDQGDRLQVMKVNTDTGAITSYTTAITGINTGLGAYMRHYWAFSTADNEFTCLGLIGTTAAKVWSLRITVNPSTLAITTNIAQSLSDSIGDTVESNSFGVRGWSRAAVWGIEGGAVLSRAAGGAIKINRVAMSRATNTATYGAGSQTLMDDNKRVSGFGAGLIWGGNNRNLSLGHMGVLEQFCDPVAVTDLYQVHYHELATASAPTGIVPAAGASMTTDVPLLKANFKLPRNIPEYRGKMVWQLATDSGFTTNLRTITEPDADLLYALNTYTGGATVTAQETVPTGSALITGTWYIRAATLDEFGRQGAWSAATTFTVAHSPSAINLSPDSAVGSASYWSATTRFDWEFSDPSPADYQTAYQILVERVDTGAVVLDTGKVVSATTQADLAISSTYKEVQLRWKIRLWDRDDAAGSYSAYKFFMLADAGVVAITVPTEGGTVTTANPTVTFTFTASGRTLNYAWVWVSQGGNIPFIRQLTAGELSSLAVQIPSGILANSTSYTVTIYVVDSLGLNALDSNSFTTSWTPPAAPVFSVNAALHATNGYTRVTWTNSTIDGNFASYRVKRRIQGDTDWEVIYETTTNQSSYTYDDWLAGTGVTYEYTVVQVTNYFGSILESVPSATAATGYNTDYWLIHPTDNLKNFNLRNVVDEGFSEEYEQTTYTVIGRGRHTDIGQRLGFKGALTAQFRDVTGLTARTQRLLLESLRAEKTFLYLRNPFGDVWKVTPGDIGITRIPGVGGREEVDVSIPYEEVAF